jgi:hypothetical protein
MYKEGIKRSRPQPLGGKYNIYRINHIPELKSAAF